MVLKRKGREFRSSKAHAIWHCIRMACGRVLYRRSIKRNAGTRILVVLHLYYMESWPYIKRYLENLSPYRYDLVVTYIADHYDPKVLEDVRGFRKDVRLAEYSNKGFDIGPFLDILSETDLKDYDIVYKLQSKGTGRNFTFVYNQVFKRADWFLNLFDGILGEFTVHRAVKMLMQNPRNGLVASANLIINDPPHKRAFTREAAAKLHVPILEYYRYVAGSCFAIKASLLSCIQDLHLTIDSFETTSRGGFTFAHGMERIICACIEPQGYSLAGIPVPHPRYPMERRYRQSVSSMTLLEDKRFSVDFDYFYRSLEMLPVYSYEIKTMKLGEIYRYWDGKLLLLKDSAPYAYINGDVDGYGKYVAANSETSAFKMSRERFDALIKSLEDNGFDRKHLPIVCASDNTVWDGLHRCCWLLSKYGEDYGIPVIYLHSPVWYHTGNGRTGELSNMQKLWRTLSYRGAGHSV